MEKEKLKAHFNTVASGATFASYEDRRWHANPKVALQQEATEAFVAGIAVPCTRGASRITELGAGPGTWTKYLQKESPRASFLLLDISGEMLARAKAALPEGTVVETIEGDFTSLSLPHAAADVFFSSRAIEYITPKEKMVRMIVEHVAPGGCIIVTTKMPKPLLNKLSGRVQGTIHRDQIAPELLAQLFRSSGVRAIALYPITFSFPLLRSARADRLLMRLFGGKPLNVLSAFFAESYGLVARKP